MHTFLQRLNALVTFAITVLAAMCIAATMTDYFHVGGADVLVKLNGINSFNKEKGQDKAVLDIKMDADLRKEFSWNTKQLYVYVMIEYATDKHPHNEMVIWNRIIQNKENAKLMIRKLQKMFPFVISADEGELVGAQFNITVAWNVMPKVGRLYTRRRVFDGHAFPNYYIE